MATPIEIATARLRLRQWRAEDRAPFAALNADPRVMEFFPALLDRAASDAMADRCEAQIAERGWGLWAVETQADGAFIGLVGLAVPAPDVPVEPRIEIGWRTAAAYWGHGYATEAARAALRVGFETLGFAGIVSFTALSNRRSRAVMERLGMRLDAQTFEHPRVPEGNPLRTHCVYRLEADQWTGQRRRHGIR